MSERRYKTRYGNDRCRIPHAETPEGRLYIANRHVRWLCRRIYQKALKTGQLKPVRGKICVDCGRKAQCYDHRNYYHPLKVDAVCFRCDSKRGEGYPYLGTQTEKSYKEIGNGFS